MYLRDLPTYDGDEEGLFAWLLQVERTATCTGRSEISLARAKADGPVYKCIKNMPMNATWEDYKRILRENFSNIRTKVHACMHIADRRQRSGESLQAFIYYFTEMMKIISGQEPKQITETYMITLFIKNVLNKDIRKSLIKANLKNLQEAFKHAQTAELKSMKYEGLMDHDTSDVNVLAIKAEPQVNQINATPAQATVPQVPTAQPGKRWGLTPDEYAKRLASAECFMCGDKGHTSRFCSENPQNQQ